MTSKFEITHKFATHAGRTKSYQVWQIARDDGRTVVINQWGTTQACRSGSCRGGQTKVETFDDQRKANIAIASIISKKERNDYNFTSWQVDKHSEHTIEARIDELFAGRTDSASPRHLIDYLMEGITVTSGHAPEPPYVGTSTENPDWGSW